MSENWVALMLLSPLIGGVLALSGKVFKGADGVFRILALLSLIGTVAALVFTASGVFSGNVIRYALGGWPEPFGISLVLDGFSWITVALIALISLLVGLFVLDDPHYRSKFFFYYLLMIFGMVGVALTGDLFTMFVSFEIIAIAAYVLIAYEQSATGLAASFKYLILSSVGILFFLFGIFLIYRDLGSLSISHISAALDEGGALRDTTAMHLALASLCVGIGVRTAFIPFHTWLPEAHAYAPHPVSAILSGVLIKVSFFAMVRLLLQFGGSYLFDLLLWIGAATSFLAVISALSQSDAKRLLAYHSVSQMGYILAVFGAASPWALTAAFFYAISHALFKSLLFLTVGTAVRMNGDRNLYRMRPLGRTLPLFAAAFFVGALSIAGMPPFIGFAGKAFISLGMKGSAAYPLLWVTGFLTIASFVKLSRIFLPGIADKPAKGTVVPLPGLLASVSVLLLALFCLAGGLFAPQIAAVLRNLLGGDAVANPPGLFSGKKLLGMLIPLVLGSGVFLFLRSSPGKKMAGVVRSYNPGLQTVLSFFFLGLLGFAMVAYN